MNRRAWFGGLLVAGCLGTLLVIWTQHRQLTRLRAEQQQLLAQLASTATAKGDGDATNSAAQAPALIVSPELLRLRSEVTRLSERRRELAGVQPENERLRAQLASRGTNGAAAEFAAGYIRKTEARMVGYQTPEDTLQSLLWALQNRDLTNMMHAFTAERAEEFLADLERSHRSSEDLFREAANVPGMGVVERRVNANDGSVELEVTILPAMPPSRVPFKQQNGEWRISGPF